MQQPPHQTHVREDLWAVLHYGKGRTGHAFDLLLMVLILLSLAILPLEFLPFLVSYHEALFMIEIITTAFFTVDYVFRIYAAPSRLRYIFSWFGLVDFLSIAPFYLGLLGTQYLRAFRLLRLLRIGEFEAAAAEEDEGVTAEGVGLTEGEDVEYVVTRHPLYLLLGSIPPIVATSVGILVLLLGEFSPITMTVATVLFLFSLIFLWKVWLDFGYDVIYITSQRLIFHNQHLMGRSINQVNYAAITNVKPYYPSILSYFCGFGSLLVETSAAESGHIELHMVRRHEHAAHLIMQKAMVAKQRPPLAP